MRANWRHNRPASSSQHPAPNSTQINAGALVLMRQCVTGSQEMGIDSRELGAGCWASLIVRFISNGIDFIIGPIVGPKFWLTCKHMYLSDEFASSQNPVMLTEIEKRCINSSVKMGDMKM
ncbi:GM23004 [Drosophila sechellia]|uniref:GM23004 n=1 Tax=Drosophila sechellia TaxID=7238 RepID=B4I7E3_DROSE|nr:GM23004 [Drosophila sechellia]